MKLFPQKFFLAYNSQNIVLKLISFHSLRQIIRLYGKWICIFFSWLLCWLIQFLLLTSLICIYQFFFFFLNIHYISIMSALGKINYEFLQFIFDNFSLWKKKPSSFSEFQCIFIHLILHSYEEKYLNLVIMGNFRNFHFPSWHFK